MSDFKFVFGAAKIACMNERDLFSVVTKLQENGICEIDTAPTYEKSEQLIGKLTNEFGSLIINTKVSTNTNGKYTPRYIRDSLNKSLDNLATNRVETFFIHSAPSSEISAEVIDTLVELREEGLCRYIGYSGDNLDLQIQARGKKFDKLMFTYNILDQSNLQIMKRERFADNLYLKRVLANGVWRNRTSRDILKDLLGKSRGHDEYRLRLKKMYPEGIANGYESSLFFARRSFPQANLLIGISSLEQCNNLFEFIACKRTQSEKQLREYEERFLELSVDSHLEAVT